MNTNLTIERELPSQAALKLRQMIVSQGLKPGDRFPSESELTKMFGVGRSTIREAIKLLVAENIVEIQRGKGTYITPTPGISNDPLGLHFSNQENLLYNLFETRLIVEPQIAYLAATRATSSDIEQLSGVLSKLADIDTSSTKLFQTTDIGFHTLLARSTQNDVLYRFLPSICESIREGGHETVNNRESQKRARNSHVLILEAIKIRNPEQARKEAELHIRQTAKDANIILEGVLL